MIHHFINSYEGDIIEPIDEGYIAIFISSKKAFDCATSIQKKLEKKTDMINYRIILYISSFHKKHLLHQKILQLK